jgi:hypothetical protein
MKFFYFLPALFLIFPLMVTAQQGIKFDDYFLDKTMRIDYFHIGDANTELITIDKIYSYGSWAGSLKNLADNFNNGKYYLKIYDPASGKLIYSKGFDTYFGEYKTSEWGLNGIKKAYHESAVIPQPKGKIRFALEKRDKSNNLEEFFTTEIDPDDIMVVRDKIADNTVKVFEGVKNGDPHVKADIAILAEGYTTQEEEKFKADLERFTNIFFKLEPYKSLKNNFNIYGVFKPSAESGADEPDAAIFKNTALSSTFYSLGSERYLLTEDNKTMRDMAAHVPYDAIYIMVNHNRYGGGGIYNLFCTFTADNQWHEYLFLHEFGHSFAGLADEYYTSDVAYNDFYPRGIEPVEPNITALVNGELKWKDISTPGIEMPAPWEKKDYDALDLVWQAKRREMNKNIATLKRTGAPADKIKEAEDEYNSMDREHNNETNAYLAKSKFFNTVGAFEGAGYASQGLYRPMLDCIMFSKGTKPFCKVCEQRIKEVILHYSE